MKLSKGQKITLGVLSTLTILLLVIGIAIPLIIQSKLTSGIDEMVVVDSFDAQGFNTWQNNTTPDSPATHMKFYIYNVTNPEEVYAGKKPILKEIGPYAYREYNVKFNISFSADGTERSYRLWEYFEFDASESMEGAKPETDQVTVINVPLQGVFGALFSMDSGPNSDWWKALVVDSLAAYSQSSLFVTVNVSDLIFRYEDPMLKILSGLAPPTSPYFQIQVNQTSMEQVYLSTNVTIEKTGKGDLSQLGQYVQYQGRKSNQCWATPEANEIRGGHGDAFSPDLTTSSQPTVYVDNLFRSSDLQSGDDFVVEGITLMQFHLREEDMLNATLNPANAQYYQFGPSGTLNLTRCNNGAPVFISKPHFLGADPSYAAPFEGLTPADPSIHDTIIGIEPITGVVMSAHKRLQVNVKLQQDSMLYPGVASTPLYFPLAWVDETGIISPSLATQFKSKVYTAQTVRLIALWGGLGGAGVLLAATIITGFAFARLNERRPRDYSRINAE